MSDDLLHDSEVHNTGSPGNKRARIEPSSSNSSVNNIIDHSMRSAAVRPVEPSVLIRRTSSENTLSPRRPSADDLQFRFDELPPPVYPQRRPYDFVSSDALPTVTSSSIKRAHSSASRLAPPLPPGDTNNSAPPPLPARSPVNSTHNLGIGVFSVDASVANGDQIAEAIPAVHSLATNGLHRSKEPSPVYCTCHREATEHMMYASLLYFVVSCNLILVLQIREIGRAHV